MSAAARELRQRDPQITKRASGFGQYPLSRRNGPLWVRTRIARREHIESALPPPPDVSRLQRMAGPGQQRASQAIHAEENEGMLLPGHAEIPQIGPQACGAAR
jgi:hypothetical protein